MPLAETQRKLFAGLAASAAARESASAGTEERFEKETADAERDIGRTRRQLAAAAKKAADDNDKENGAAVRLIGERYDTAEAEAAEVRQSLRARTVTQYSAQLQKLRSEAEDKNWTIDSLKEAADKEATDKHTSHIREAALAEEHLADRWVAVGPKLARAKLDRPAISFDPTRLPSATPTDPVGKLQKSLEDVDKAAERVLRAKADRLLTLWPTLVAVVGFGLLGAGIGIVVQGETVDPITVAGFAVGLAFGGGLITRGVLILLARKQLESRGKALGVYMAEADRAVTNLRTFADRERIAGLKHSADRHEANKRKAHDFYTPRIQASEKSLAQKLQAIDQSAAQTAKELGEGREEELTLEAERHAEAVDRATAAADAELADAEAKHAARTSAAEVRRAASWTILAADWHAALADAGRDADELHDNGDAHFPPMTKLKAMPLATTVPEGIRIGRATIDLARLPGGVPTDPRLVGEAPRGEVPLFAPFPERGALLLKAADAERGHAVGVLQAAMLRYLTAVPPGKVRFTVIDPVGLGENFAAFMHLADFDEKLITSRIWTEPAHIESRLSDLTEHMETVIQKYLRNQYKSIEDYNRAAGEVAEPYRVLVIANFPTNFTPEAARRLISILASGPACGVCTLMSVDTKAALPRDFRVSELEQSALTLMLKEGSVTPAGEEFAAFPVTLDKPPSAELTAEVVRKIGQASLSAARVEVPFSYIAPTEGECWKSSASKGFEVPIGRAGATRRQVLSLGKGTAQHALVAGKTGSGKSTLLHAIITNLALYYSPDEAELYLIDFKKGVEFQAYAEAKLPHARVIAVESEREFGLSVLQRLDGVLRERGDRFRDLGVNDLNGFRQAKPDAKCPRILLVVDEFQEFFVEDDKIAQEASLMLDRLVRQGRAFGVHVLLGSQTLGGAYSIPRATIDQMAVRVALQCSEADAQLILSKDNTAARLLNRPGEAIYNDANGLVEGNDPFQVVWLSDSERAERLADLHKMAEGRDDPAPLIFSGNAAADLASNPMLKGVPSGPPTVILGEPVAITAPTSSVFRAQSGANLLLLGQLEEAALAIQVSAMLGLGRRGYRVSLLDGTPDDADNAGYLQAACDTVPTATFTPRDQLATLLGELADDLDKRTSGESPREPRFLLVHGLHRLRELKKADEDFGFGKKEGPVAPGELFARLLRDGPPSGLFIIAWCDSLTNLQRALDRQALKEFASRVLFQMSATDSSQLIDTPAAARLGRNRALYLADGAERPEKFRPYGLPGLAGLARLAEASATAPPAPALPAS